MVHIRMQTLVNPYDRLCTDGTKVPFVPTARTVPKVIGLALARTLPLYCNFVL